jgi:hypothetical protein
VEEKERNPTTPLSESIYEIPMDTALLVVLARLSAMWGQIEKQMDLVLSAILKVDRAQYRASYERVVLSTKLSHLWRELSRSKHGEHRTALIEMHRSISACIDDRNAIAHGMWGWHYLLDQNAYRVGCHSAFRDQPFWLRDIYDLHERMADAAAKCDLAYHAAVLKSEVPPSRNRRYILAPREACDEHGTPRMGPPPDWRLGW